MINDDNDDIPKISIKCLCRRARALKYSVNSTFAKDPNLCLLTAALGNGNKHLKGLYRITSIDNTIRDTNIQRKHPAITAIADPRMIIEWGSFRLMMVMIQWWWLWNEIRWGQVNQPKTRAEHSRKDRDHASES